MPKVRFNKLKGLVQDGGEGFFVDSLSSMGVSGSTKLVTAATYTVESPGVYVLSMSVSSSRKPFQNNGGEGNGVTVTLPDPSRFPGSRLFFRDGCLDTAATDGYPENGIKTYGRGQTHCISASQTGAAVGQIVGWGTAGDNTATINARKLIMSQSFFETTSTTAGNPGGSLSGASVSLLSDGIHWRIIGQVGSIELKTTGD